MTARTAAYKAGLADALAGHGPDPDSHGDGFDYDRGYQDGLEQLEETGSGETESPRSRRPRSTSTPRSSSSSRRRSSRRRSSPGRKAARAVTAPVARQVGSAVSVLGSAVLIAFLYNLLTHTDSATGAIGGVAGVVRWLDDPTRSIPYRKS